MTSLFAATPLFGDLTDLIAEYLPLFYQLECSSTKSKIRAIQSSSENINDIWLLINIGRISLINLELIFDSFDITLDTALLNNAVMSNNKDVTRWLLEKNCEGDDYTSEYAILHSADTEMIDMIYNAGLINLEDNETIQYIMISDYCIQQWYHQKQ